MVVLKIVLRERNGMLHFDARVWDEGETKRLRFSSDLKITEENRLFLDLNARAIVSEYFKNKRVNLKEFYKLLKQNQKLLFKEQVKLFLNSATGLKLSSQKSIKNRLAPALQFFNDYRVDEIDREAVCRFYDFLEKKKNKLATLKTQAGAFRAILDLAEEQGLIEKNPFFKKKYTREPKKEINVFSEEEIKSLLKNAKGEIGLYLKVALLTGARTGELLGLQFKHIDFEKAKLRIEQSISPKNGGISTCKTQNSVRTIDLLPPLLAVLKEEKERRRAGDEEFLFLRTNGRSFIKDFHRSYLKVQYISLLASLNIAFRPIYNTRHSFASWMLSRGENLMWVSFMMGHKSTQITLNYYGKFIDNPNDKRATFVENIFKEDGDEVERG